MTYNQMYSNLQSYHEQSAQPSPAIRAVPANDESSNNADRFPIFQIREIPAGDRCPYHIRQINKLLQSGRGLFESLEEHMTSNAFLSMRPTSRKTVKNQIRSAIQTYLGRALINDMLAGFALDCFFKSFKWKSKRTAAGVALSPDQLGDLIKYSGLRTSMLFQAAYLLSHRVTEICNIRQRDIRRVNAINYSLTFPECKTELNATILVSVELIDAINEIFHGKEFLFETSSGKKYKRQDIYNLFVDASLRILGFAVTPHDLRRTFANTTTLAHPDKQSQIMRHGSWTDLATFDRHYKRPPLLLPEAIPQPQWDGIRSGYVLLPKERRVRVVS